jgi:hypothetical protein
LSKLVKWDGEGISADMTSSLGVKKYHQSQLQSDFIPMLMHEPQRALLPYPGTESRWEWTESVFLIGGPSSPEASNWTAYQLTNLGLDRLPVQTPRTGPPALCGPHKSLTSTNALSAGRHTVTTTN